MNLPVINAASANRFDQCTARAGDSALRGISIQTVQVNIGLRCNLACHHCHVESSPKRQEEMSWQTMEQVLAAAAKSGAATLDITGGAPEMHPDFRRFVLAAIAKKLHVMVRTNLTIMLESDYQDLPEFYAKNKIHLIASLPCYLETNVDHQRGKYVYRESIEVIQRLNALGFGAHEDMPLDLVYNPGGPTLPPNQVSLEADYRRELAKHFGIRFTRLYTITNVPIGRFLHDLSRQGYAAKYIDLLERTFNPTTVPELMCRHQVHIGWDGTLYDCDFNYAIKLPAEGSGHISTFEPQTYLARRIATGDHCLACTAGGGSSCGGSLVDNQMQLNRNAAG